MATSPEVRAMVRTVKALYKKYGFTCSKISNSPYSNSVYFNVYGLDNRLEIRVSDHDYPNHNHNFRGYDFNLDLGAEAMEELLEEIKWEISE